jgi:hypothetical protein
VPSIARLLVFMDDSNRVIHSFLEYFRETPWNAKASIAWMKRFSFAPSPALDAMLTEPLVALTEHELMRDDDKANQKIWGPGLAFLQILAIQHSLGEVWNLNGETLLHIQAGHLVSSAPLAYAALDVVWLSVDPVVTGRELMAQLLILKTEFLDAHTVHKNSSDVIFYRRISDLNPELTLAPVDVEHAGRAILTAVDLPSQPSRPRGTKRVFEGHDVFDGKTVKRYRKYKPKPTPPDVRRSHRLRSAIKRRPRVGT